MICMKKIMTEIKNMESKIASMKSLSKIDKSEFDTNAQTFFKALENNGLANNAKIDAEGRKGEFTVKGLPVTFHLGGENVYFDLPHVFFKDTAEEGVSAVKNLLEVVSNYGGVAK